MVYHLGIVLMYTRQASRNKVKFLTQKGNAKVKNKLVNSQLINQYINIGSQFLVLQFLVFLVLQFSSFLVFSITSSQFFNTLVPSFVSTLVPSFVSTLVSFVSTLVSQFLVLVSQFLVLQFFTLAYLSLPQCQEKKGPTKVSLISGGLIQGGKPLNGLGYGLSSWNSIDVYKVAVMGKPR